MESKEYLESYRRIAERLKVLTVEIERLRTEAESVSINLDGMPHGQGKGDRLERLAIQLADMESKLQEEMSECWSKRMEIVSELGKLKEPKHFTILHARYIEGKTWERIAVDMDITWRYCYMLHGRALTEFEKVLKG